MIEKFKDSLISEIEKKFKNPFLGAFIISWIFFNWDIVYVILFLDEKYVSIIPEIGNIKDGFITKFEYIDKLNILNIYKGLVYPLISSFVLVVFVELFTNWLIVWLNIAKNWIKGKELLSKNDSLKLKKDLVNFKIESRKDTDLLNEEILLEKSKNDEYKLKMNDKVNEKIKEKEELNLKRIKELQNNLDNSNKISKERLKEKNILDKQNSEINNEKQTIFEKYNFQIKKNKEVSDENNELKSRLEKLDKPLEEKYIEEYSKFKNSHFFSNFDNFIDEIVDNPYTLTNKFYGKDLKYLSIKNIVDKLEDQDINGNIVNEKYIFTEKGNKFVELFLDEYEGNDLNKKISEKKKIEEEISVEDIPF